MKLPKRLHDWWFGEPPSVKESPGLMIFGLGTPPLLSRLIKRLRWQPLRWILAAVVVSLIGWAVFVAMKKLTGLG